MDDDDDVLDERDKIGWERDDFSRDERVVEENA